ncbi:hypothetical protein AVEN_243245-1, partial [Araneus ventricosus]
MDGCSWARLNNVNCGQMTKTAPELVSPQTLRTELAGGRLAT